MIRKVWYMILVLITIYLEIMYDSTWMLAMLAFELLLAAVMFLMSWYLKLHIRVWLDMKVPVSAKKQTFRRPYRHSVPGLPGKTSEDHPQRKETAYGTSGQEPGTGRLRRRPRQIG